MAHSDVLLLEKVEKLGAEGDQVRVKSGFARNYLFPRGVALPVNRANKKHIEALQKARAAREAEELKGAEDIAEKIKATSIAFALKTGSGGTKTFGSISVANIHERFAENGISLDKKVLSLAAPVKTLGKHSVRVKLHADIQFDFEFEVVSENPIEEDAQEEA